jgi:hypothetical protein
MKKIIQRLAGVGLVVGIAAVLAGCGGGGSHNEDFGISINHQDGSKVIHRSLENDSDRYLTVDLYLNGNDHLDTLQIRPRDFINVQIDHLYVDEWIEYQARFDNGDTTSGRFSEDGRTIFSHGDSRAAGSGMVATDVNGHDAVKQGGAQKQIDAHKPQPK